MSWSQMAVTDGTCNASHQGGYGELVRKVEGGPECSGNYEVIPRLPFLVTSLLSGLEVGTSRRRPTMRHAT